MRHTPSPQMCVYVWCARARTCKCYCMQLSLMWPLHNGFLIIDLTCFPSSCPPPPLPLLPPPVKRYREPLQERRPFWIWVADTTKQALGMLEIHFVNLIFSSLIDANHRACFRCVYGAEDVSFCPTLVLDHKWLHLDI